MKNSESFSFGLVEQPFDPNDVWEDEVLAGDTLKLPESYRISGLTYEYQGAYPFCVSFAGTTMLEYKYRESGASQLQAYSQTHLFFHSGGSTRGSYLRRNLDILTDKGAIPYEKMPQPSLDLYKTGDWHSILYAKAQVIPFNDVKKVGGYVRIDAWDKAKIRQAIIQYGPLMVSVQAWGNSYYTDPWHVRASKSDNHCVVLVGWTNDNRWILFDSLNYVRQGKEWGGTPLEAGYRTVSPDYTFNSVYAIAELPEDWRDMRDEARKAPTNNEARYGQGRDYPREVEVANQMLKEFNKFNNQSVTDAAGRFWEMYIRAVVYGGYSVSYRKWGRWQPGDIINDCYNWRRTGEHIFDFNKLRHKHK